MERPVLKRQFWFAISRKWITWKINVLHLCELIRVAWSLVWLRRNETSSTACFTCTEAYQILPINGFFFNSCAKQYIPALWSHQTKGIAHSFIWDLSRLDGSFNHCRCLLQTHSGHCYLVNEKCYWNIIIKRWKLMFCIVPQHKELSAHNSQSSFMAAWKCCCWNRYIFWSDRQNFSCRTVIFPHLK